MSLANKFDIPQALFDTIKKMNEEKKDYDAKVRALMAKRGIKSIGDLSPEEKKDFFNTLDSMHQAKNEEVELEEAKSSTGYDLYHKDFSSAMAHAYDFAKKKYNIEIDPLEIDRNVAMGPRKPSSGKANAYRLLDKTGKKAIQVQVANLDNKRYELNMYKEDVELEENLSSSQRDTHFSLMNKHGVLAKSAKGAEKDKHRMAALDHQMALRNPDNSQRRSNALSLSNKLGVTEEVEQIDEISLKDRLAGKTAPVVKSKYNRTKANRPMTGKELERHNRSKQLDFEKMPKPDHAKDYTLKHVSSREVEGELGDATDHTFHILHKGKKVGEHHFAGYFGHGTTTIHGHHESDTGYIGDTEGLHHYMKTKKGHANVFGKKEGEQKHVEYVAKHGIKKYPNIGEEVEQIDESMSAAQIKKLRDAYGNIDKIDVSGQPYKNLVAFLDKQNLDTLKMLAGAKIKFISPLAQNRVVRKMNESIGSTVGGALGQYAGSKMGLEGPGRAHGEVLGRQLEKFARELFKKLTKEEVEEVDEVLDTPSKALGYIVKATVSGLKSGALDTGKFRKRQAGVNKAIEKTKSKISKMSNEEVEELDEISADVAKRVAQRRDQDFRKNTPTDTQKRRMGRGDWRADPQLHADKAEKSAIKRGAKDVHGYNESYNQLFAEAAKKMSKKKEATSKDNNKSVMSGDKLSGKQEPIEIDPEIKE